jgi:nucleotide-binding universal stress UspA family protein
MTIEVYRPAGQLRRDRLPRAFRLERLDGVVISTLDNGKAGAAELLEALLERLVDAGAVAGSRLVKGSPGAGVVRGQLDQLTADSGAVLNAIAD